jgi:hypothetical protein
VLDDDSRVGSQAASVSACDFRPIHPGIGDLLEPLFGNVSVNWPRTLADRYRSVPGVPVEDGLCHDEVEQSYPRILQQRESQTRPCSTAKRVAAARELTPSLW